MRAEFRNEPVYTFEDDSLKKQMTAAIAKLEAEAGKEYDLVIGGEHVKGDGTFDSLNPSDKSVVVGRFQKGTPELADKAIKAADYAFEQWSRKLPEERAEYVFRAADVLRRRRLEFVAAMVLEEGKNWIEADGDFCEALDFLEFYAREAIRYGKDQGLTPFPGEENSYFYIPLGAGVVIPPWNFPLAILVGMTTAAFVSGNTVVLKPSSDSPLLGYMFMEVLEEVKLPAGVVNFFTGRGGAVGDTLVSHERTRFISFTGSREVGLHIVELAAKTVPGQIWIKRIVAEMGGKDAIIVDSEADVDAAAKGTAIASFGFQGQKCSACSRAILHQDVYDEVLKRVAEKAKMLTVGDTTGEDNLYMGAVIDEASYKKINDYIGIGKKEGRPLLVDTPVPRDGYFVPPTIFADIDRNARLAQEEIFGPVLAVIKARDFDDGLDIANGTIYGLTGALYSSDRMRLERARHEFHVGNLYFNRKCTGALVDVQPFGGFNMSGTDSKAGGRDYLLLFMQGKSITERL
ncbi:L-glutamate gamma-semialdehyde dehydrogenase [bacterium]|nr:L-glutamate gamma-semialdehyde dehydrogenase [bacterium]